MRRFALAVSILLLAACVGTRDTPGAPWLVWATLRSLAGMPPMPPDFYAEPVRVSDTLKFAEITAGGEHTCALTVDGETWCWGANRYQQLGRAATTQSCGDGPGAYSCSSAPVRVEDAPRFRSLAATRWGTCGLDTSGAVHCWGYGLGGRDDASAPVSRGTPLEVPAEQTFVSLASSASSFGKACGLTADGQVWCWSLSDGESGDASEIFAGPALVPTSTKLVSIGFGGGHGCGIDEARTAHCWGENDYGSLGAGSSGHQGGMRESPTPVPVQGGLQFEEVVAGSGHSCGVTSEGSLYCWGYGYPIDGERPAYPRLSGEPPAHGALPVPVDAGDTTWRTLSAGGMQTCALDAEGTAHCFRAMPIRGGDGRPARVDSDHSFIELAVGSHHVCAIGTDAFAYCWGNGFAGQVGRPPSGRRW